MDNELLEHLIIIIKLQLIININYFSIMIIIK